MLKNGTSYWLIVAAVTAFFSTLLAIFVGEILGKEPCSLCWYQRICLFPLAWILLLASFRSDNFIWRYALPLAMIGSGFAIYHNFVFWKEIIKDSTQGLTQALHDHSDMTIFGIVPLPLISLLGSIIIVFSLFLVQKKA